MLDLIRDLRTLSRFSFADGRPEATKVATRAADELDTLNNAKAHYAYTRAFGRSFLASYEKDFMA